MFASKLSIAVGCFSLLTFETVVFVFVSASLKYKLYRGQFMVVLQLVLYIGSRFFWKHLVTNVVTPSTPKVLVLPWKFALFLFFCLAHSAVLTNLWLYKDPSLLGMSSWLCFGAFILLFSILFPLTVVSDTLNRLSTVKVITPRRQAFLAVVLTTAVTTVGFLNAIGEPKIIRVDVPIKNLPTDEFRIGLISDIHLSASVGYTMLSRIVRMTNDLNPDMIVLAGDLTDGTVSQLGESASPVKLLKAKYGKYFVTGNHEYYTGDVEAWFNLLQQAGFHILHNSNIKIRTGAGEDSWFCLLGTDDIQSNQISYTGHGMDLDKAYQGCDISHPSILVAHQPKAAKYAIDSKYDFQLILSGHTHGGQMHPITWLTRLVNPFFSGLYKSKGTYVYVSQGACYYGFPIRLGSDPEITEITLRPEKRQGQ